MAYGTRFMSALGVALDAYRKAMHASSPVRQDASVLEAFDSVDNRIGRYCFWWAHYQNNAYDTGIRPHAAGQFKTDWALGKNTRGCYNPFFRLGNFWAQHVWIGPLDANKQNGRVADTAIPILTEAEAIREPLNRLWRDSRWAQNKNLLPREGAVLGDFAARVEDDPKAGKVRILPINPATIKWVKKDYQGNVDGYVICEKRWDPRYDPRTDRNQRQTTVDYEERCFLDGGRVYYETYLDEAPYAWNGVSAKWSVDYGFVPLAVSPHIQPLPDSIWGWSEYHGALTKAVEADHVGSNLHSQIRKAAEPKYWVSGTQPPAQNLRFQGDAPSKSDPQPGAQELPFFYGGVGSSASALVFPLDIQFTSMEIQFQITNLEKDYPEIRYESARATGDASAKALREVRKACEAKVHGQRVVYDDALVRLQKMALSIGGMRGYPGYEAFPRGSYEAGKLDHAIGERTVFLLDPLDRAEEKKALYDNWLTAKSANVPARFFMKHNGFSAEEIADFEKDLAEEQAKALEQQKAVIEATAAARPEPASAA